MSCESACDAEYDNEALDHEPKIPPTIPAKRTRNCSRVVVRSRIVSDMGSISYLKKIPCGNASLSATLVELGRMEPPSPGSGAKYGKLIQRTGTPRPCSVSLLMSVTEYWLVCRMRRRAST